MSGNGTSAFAGKVAFITGAAGGIGRATAIAIATEGAKVVASDISEEGIQETVRPIEAQGGHALAVPCDVTRSEDIAAAIAATVNEFGRLDVAFNNAGVEQPPAAVADTGEAEWDRIVTINLRDVFPCMKHEIPVMLETGGGAIVNTSSGAGVIGIAGQAAYAASKWGLIGLTSPPPWTTRHPECGSTRSARASSTRR